MVLVESVSLRNDTLFRVLNAKNLLFYLLNSKIFSTFAPESIHAPYRSYRLPIVHNPVCRRTPLGLLP